MSPEIRRFFLSQLESTEVQVDLSQKIWLKLSKMSTLPAAVVVGCVGRPAGVPGALWVLRHVPHVGVPRGEESVAAEVMHLDLSLIRVLWIFTPLILQDPEKGSDSLNLRLTDPEIQASAQLYLASGAILWPAIYNFITLSSLGRSSRTLAEDGHKIAALFPNKSNSYLTDKEIYYFTGQVWWAAFSLLKFRFPVLFTKKTSS